MGSEMCIRDRYTAATNQAHHVGTEELLDVQRFGFVKSFGDHAWSCLLYTSDAADERSSVDLGGRRIIKKKKRTNAT